MMKLGPQRTAAEKKARLDARKADIERRVLEALGTRQRGAKAIAADAGVTAPTARRTLSRLRDAGRVSASKDGAGLIFSVINVPAAAASREPPRFRPLTSDPFGDHAALAMTTRRR